MATNTARFYDDIHRQLMDYLCRAHADLERRFAAPTALSFLWSDSTECDATAPLRGLGWQARFSRPYPVSLRTGFREGGGDDRTLVQLAVDALRVRYPLAPLKALRRRHPAQAGFFRNLEGEDVIDHPHRQLLRAEFWEDGVAEHDWWIQHVLWRATEDVLPPLRKRLGCKVGKEGISGAGPRGIELAEDQLVELRGLHGHAPTDAFLLEFFGLLTADPALPRAWLRALPASLRCEAAPAKRVTSTRGRSKKAP